MGNPSRTSSFLVHELAHLIMNIGMCSLQRKAVATAYREAKDERLYDLEFYMMANDMEYWATGAQAWFDAIEDLDLSNFLSRI